MSPRRAAKLLATFGTIALGVVLVVTIVVVRHRSSHRNLASNALGIVPGALLHAHNFHWTQMKAGHAEWTLKARDANYADDKTSLALIDPELSMTATDGKIVKLTAKRADLKVNGNHVDSASLSGDLVIHYGDFVLSTERATFLPDKDQLDAPGTVKIESPDFTVTGVGLTGHPKAETFELRNQVETHITPRQKRETTKIS